MVALHEPGADDLGDDDRCRHADDPMPRAGSPDRRVRHPCPVPDQPAVPQHCPSPRELDDLELLTHGAFGLTGFEGPGGLVTLPVPTDVAAAAQDAGALELVDPEGLPLARVDRRVDVRRGRPHRDRRRRSRR